MRRNLTLVAVVLAVLVLTTGCRNKPPLIPAAPVGPDSVAKNTLVSYSAVTTDPNNDQVLYVFAWGDGAFDTTPYYASGVTVTQGHAWADIGAYPVRCRAKDERGEFWSDWSDSLLVRVWVGDTAAHQPPDKPLTPWGPDTGWVGDAQVFRTAATDPDGDSVRIKYIWDDGMVSLWSPLVASGDTVTDSVTYYSRGLKQVRAIAIDTDSMLSDTSDPFYHYADQVNTPPDKPVIDSTRTPPRGIPNGPWYRFYASARDPQGDSVQYKFFWGDGHESDWTQLGPYGIPVMDSWRYTQLGTWQVRCLCRDQFDAVSDTSDPFEFETVAEGTVLWAHLLADDVTASPAFAPVAATGETRDAVIVTLTNGHLLALDALQGTVLYDELVLDDDIHSSPTVGGDGTVYFAATDGRVYAYTQAGQFKWVWPDTATYDEINTTVAVSGSDLYFGGTVVSNNYLYRLTDQGNQAELQWRYQLKDDANASPAIDQAGNIIACDDSGTVYSFTPSGDTNWTYDTQFLDLTPSPAITAEGKIHVAADTQLISLNPDGSLSWTYTLQNEGPSSPVIGQDGSTYLADGGGWLYRVLPDGQAAPGWPVQLDTAAAQTSTPTLTQDDKLYVVADDDYLYAVNSDATLHWRVLLEAPGTKVLGYSGPRYRPFAAEDLLSSPVLDAWGIIYAVADTRLGAAVLAIAGRAAGTLQNAPWPMFHHDQCHTGKVNTW